MKFWPKLQNPSQRPILGRVHGILLVLLGAIVITVLIHQSGGHRARLAAEILGIALGGGVTLLVFGLARPSPQVVTQAYRLLSPHTLVSLATGMTGLYGFALATAIVHHVLPQLHLKEVPGVGGMVTLVWVFALMSLGIAGSTLIGIGMMAIAARADAMRARHQPVAGAALERLWAAANGEREHALRMCFAQTVQGDQVLQQWLACAGPLGSSHVVLVRAATSGGRLWSEWYAHNYTDNSVRRWVLSATEQAERIGPDGEVFQYASA